MRLNTLKQPRLLIFALAALISLAGCGGNGSDIDPQTEAIAAENLAKGKAFLEENGKKEGVVTMESGIQYKVLHETEEGRFPKLTDNVHIHLRMSHLDGTLINDTYQAGEPAAVYVKHAILGWRKTIPQMRVGSKWMVYIPPHMAFSSRGNSNEGVAPNETLICEIELVDIIW